MKLPRPKSLPGLFLYGIALIALLLVGRFAWDLVDLNFQQFATAQGWDRLWSDHGAILAKWLMDNLFWVSISTASVVAFALGAWATIGILDVDRWWRARTLLGTTAANVVSDATRAPLAADPVKVREKALERVIENKLAALIPMTPVETSPVAPAADPLDYLLPRSGERAAKPHVEIRTSMDSGQALDRKDRAPEIRSTMTLINLMSSIIPRCTVRVESVQCDGVLRAIDLPLISGPDSPEKFSIDAKSGKNIRLLTRVHNIVPEKPFELHAATLENKLVGLRYVPLDDNKTYYVNVFVDTFSGVFTRAVFKAELGEYAEMMVSLLGQASWRRPQTDTATGTPP